MFGTFNYEEKNKKLIILLIIGLYMDHLLSQDITVFMTSLVGMLPRGVTQSFLYLYNMMNFTSKRFEIEGMQHRGSGIEITVKVKYEIVTRT